MAEPTVSRPWWRRGRLRLTLRGLIVIIVLLGVWMGWVTRRARVQREAVAAIREAGGAVTYDYELSYNVESPYLDTPPWLVKLLGVDYFATVERVNFNLTPGMVDDPVMASVGRLDRLVSLNLANHREVNDRSLSYFRGLREIKSLILRGTGITGDGLVHLEGMRKLEDLYLGSLPLDNDQLKHLAGLTSLDSLSIEASQITDAGLAHLRGLKGLTSLSLGLNRITSAGLVHLQGMAKLKRLNLTNTLVKSLEPIHRLDQLHTLALIRTPLNDDGLAAVSSLPHLNILHLEDTPITDAGFKHLIGLKELADLRLSRTKITDVGLTHLADLSSHPAIDLRATGVTDAGMTRLKVRRPQLTINPLWLPKVEPWQPALYQTEGSAPNPAPGETGPEPRGGLDP